MASTKKRKFDNENHAFKKEWIKKHAFIPPTSNSNPYCFICSQNVALVKSRYETKHSGYEEKYEQETKSS